MNKIYDRYEDLHVRNTYIYAKIRRCLRICR